MSVFFHPKSGPTVRLVEYDIVLWGAGGGGPTYGGCGGFTRAYNGYVLAGQVLKILVGQAGTTTATGVRFGGGGPILRTGGGGSGGGYTGVFLDSVSFDNVLAIAGGGGGATSSIQYGGPGGGSGGSTSGRNGQSNDANDRYGRGASASAGGAGGSSGGYAGSALLGAQHENEEGDEGAGGGGYYGGGGGSRQSSAGVGSGGGGSSFVIPYLPIIIDEATLRQYMSRTYDGVGTGTTTPAQTGHADYPGDVAGAEQPGYAVITLGGVKYTFAYTGAEETLIAA